MTIEETIDLIERVLMIEPNTLNSKSVLSDYPNWDSLAILNLQIELTVMRPDVQFEQLYLCQTVEDICKLVGVQD